MGHSGVMAIGLNTLLFGAEAHSRPYTIYVFSEKTVGVLESLCRHGADSVHYESAFFLGISLIRSFPSLPGKDISFAPRNYGYGK